MKTTVEVPDGLFREAKAYAARHGMPVREVFELGLRLVLEGSPFRPPPLSIEDDHH